MKYPQIAQRVFHTPLLAARSKAASFVLGLGPRILDGTSVEIDGGQIDADVAPSRKPYASLLDNRLGEEIRSGRRDAYRMIDNVAVIPITGVLVHRGAWIGSYSGETSYEGIAAQIEAAASAQFCEGIALEIDSHGGEVAGCFDLADLIREVRETKPVQAFVADHAYSAAYAIASQADRIIVPRTGGVGSIGVICMHADYSRQLEEMGVKVTIIAAGQHKGDANPYEPLPDSVRDELEQEMESLRVIFAETVASGRGDRLSVEAALSTEARCLLASDAVAAGLADEVANPREAFERFVSETSGRRQPSAMATQKGLMPMTKVETNAPEDEVATPEDEAEQIIAPDEDADDASVGADQPEALASAPAEPAAVDQKKRIASILNADEAKGREELAKSLAFNSDMSAEEAKLHLAAAPKAASGGLSAVLSSDDTDLDIPAASAGGENLVKSALKSRFN
ncbi:S49 family peptidase [Albibacillus kandeliae]|uniref:S49 family peptidase n=1 Tax=Albibacillus kandeliae TaxID=2174228 RepID=UPI000D68AFFC|nr:S49 family peptidase [Albibacillus kandeliae]